MEYKFFFLNSHSNRHSIIILHAPTEETSLKQLFLKRCNVHNFWWWKIFTHPPDGSIIRNHKSWFYLHPKPTFLYKYNTPRTIKWGCKTGKTLTHPSFLHCIWSIWSIQIFWAKHCANLSIIEIQQPFLNFGLCRSRSTVILLNWFQWEFSQDVIFKLCQESFLFSPLNLY